MDEENPNTSLNAFVGPLFILCAILAAVGFAHADSDNLRLSPDTLSFGRCCAKTAVPR